MSFPQKVERIYLFDKQCVRLNSGNLNSYSGNLNTDSGKSRKVFSLKPESVFNLNQNRCSDWIRMGVQVEPEYAVGNPLPTTVPKPPLQSIMAIMHIIDVFTCFVMGCRPCIAF